MIDIDTFERILDSLAEEIPREFYDELNLGIVISEETKHHPEETGSPLYIMGEYQINSAGRGIVIYYGSFKAAYSHLSEEELTKEMRKVLRHEFRHHMENRSGLRDLEIIDQMNLAKMTGKID